MKIHKEGYTSILITLFVLLVLNLSLSLAVNRIVVINYIVLILSLAFFTISIMIGKENRSTSPSKYRSSHMVDSLVLSACPARLFIRFT